MLFKHSIDKHLLLIEEGGFRGSLGHVFGNKHVGKVLSTSLGGRGSIPGFPLLVILEGSKSRGVSADTPDKSNHRVIRSRGLVGWESGRGAWRTASDWWCKDGIRDEVVDYVVVEPFLSDFVPVLDLVIIVLPPMNIPAKAVEEVS